MGLSVWQLCRTNLNRRKFKFPTRDASRRLIVAASTWSCWTSLDASSPAVQIKEVSWVWERLTLLMLT